MDERERTAAASVEGVDRFNAAGVDAALAEVQACNASRRWARELVAGRPYPDLAAVDAASEKILQTLPWDDVREAMDAHPRIGERAGGDAREAAWSRQEQAGAVGGDFVAANREYEDRFGHVFLICATGLSAAEILSSLRERLGNDDATEREIVRRELAKITSLRLAKSFQDRGIRLAGNEYGKAEVRLVRVVRDTPRHEITDLNVSVALAGDLDATHLTGDNTDVLPTDTQKNTVYAFAKEYGVGEIEEFAARLARHFVDAHPSIRRARVRVEQYGWDRTGDHSFARSGAETRTATVTYDGRATTTVSGLHSLTLLNSTGSEFRGYRRDAYTTLPEAEDRILATDVTARWRHAETSTDFGKSYREARRHLVEAFADTYSRSLQQTLYAMGRRVLENRPELCEVRLSLPNRHHLLVDLSPFALANPNEVFYAADRPYGLIEGTVIRDGAPAPGLAWW